MSGNSSSRGANSDKTSASAFARPTGSVTGRERSRQALFVIADFSPWHIANLNSAPLTDNASQAQTASPIDRLPCRPSGSWSGLVRWRPVRTFRGLGRRARPSPSPWRHPGSKSGVTAGGKDGRCGRAKVRASTGGVGVLRRLPPMPSWPDLFRPSTSGGIAVRAGRGRDGGGTWMAGTSPAMTEGGVLACRVSCPGSRDPPETRFCSSLSLGPPELNRTAVALFRA